MNLQQAPASPRGVGWSQPSLLATTSAIVAGFLAFAGPVMAADAPKAADPVVIDTGSTAWLLISAALVLLMIPGLALFYGGMVRAKNVLNTFLNVMICTGVIGLIWVVIGYAIVFPVIDQPDGSSKALISVGKSPLPDPDDATKTIDTTVSLLGFDSNLMFLRAFGTPAEVVDGVTTANAGWTSIVTSGDTVGAKPTGVPELAFVLFQGMFFVLTAALIVGSIAERVRFGPLLLFLSIWSIVVYAPVAHMVWNVNGYLFQKGVLDFAGGTVVHVLAGVSADRKSVV